MLRMLRMLRHGGSLKPLTFPAREDCDGARRRVEERVK